eukprot:PLAT13981.1.p2 GENE.PLAT13981.1~~PLAT13981.1.p2  ORF type:complete len:542 (+),score=167.17 PLAT13981.1:168-1793(+)
MDDWHNITFLWDGTLPEEGASAGRVAVAGEEDEGKAGERVISEGKAVEDVHVVGDFNGWSADSEWAMEQGEDGMWRLDKRMLEGFYAYKFLVNGHLYVRDPTATTYEGYGSGNSILLAGVDAGLNNFSEPAVAGVLQPRSLAYEAFDRVDVAVPDELAALGIAPRPLFVMLPHSYGWDKARSYPVLYALDGQNMWSTAAADGGPFGGGWHLDATVDRMWREGSVKEFIIVGVPNADFCGRTGNRKREYCVADFGSAFASPFMRYMAEVVKPAVDARYRTLAGAADSAVLGSSMAGLCAFTLVLSHSESFGVALAMSPSFWYNDAKFESAFSLVRAAPKRDVVLYIDSGDGPGDNMYETREMDAVLREMGWLPDRDYKYFLDACAGRRDMGITHTEEVWRARMHVPLNFLYGAAVVFLVGDLKRGCKRHALLGDGAVFLGTAETQDLYPLAVREGESPLLLDLPGNGNNVRGDVFRVDKATIARLGDEVFAGLKSQAMMIQAYVPAEEHRIPDGCSLTCWLLPAEESYALLGVDFLAEYVEE